MAVIGLTLYTAARKHKANWSERICAMQAAYNTTVSTATNITPHKLLLGYDFEPITLVSWGINREPLAPDQESYLKNFEGKIKAIREDAKIFNDLYKTKCKNKFDKKAKKHQYKEGQMVYAQIPKPKMGYKKYQAKYQGPYTLSEPLGPTMVLTDTEGNYAGRHNVNKFRPFQPQKIPIDTKRAQEIEDADPIWDTNLYTAKRERPPSATKPSKKQNQKGIILRQEWRDLPKPGMYYKVKMDNHTQWVHEDSMDPTDIDDYATQPNRYSLRPRKNPLINVINRSKKKKDPKERELTGQAVNCLTNEKKISKNKREVVETRLEAIQRARASVFTSFLQTTATTLDKIINESSNQPSASRQQVRERVAKIKNLKYKSISTKRNIFNHNTANAQIPAEDASNIEQTSPQLKAGSKRKTTQTELTPPDSREAKRRPKIVHIAPSMRTATRGGPVDCNLVPGHQNKNGQKEENEANTTTDEDVKPAPGPQTVSRIINENQDSINRHSSKEDEAIAKPKKPPSICVIRRSRTQQPPPESPENVEDHTNMYFQDTQQSNQQQPPRQDVNTAIRCLYCRTIGHSVSNCLLRTRHERGNRSSGSRNQMRTGPVHPGTGAEYNGNRRRNFNEEKAESDEEYPEKEVPIHCKTLAKC